MGIGGKEHPCEWDAAWKRSSFASRKKKEQWFVSAFSLQRAEGELQFAVQVTMNLFKAAVRSTEGAPTGGNDTYHQKKKEVSSSRPSLH